MGNDRVGLGWRGAIATSILAHLDEIDVLEVIAEQLWHGGDRLVSAMTSLAARVPIFIHGTTLGLATATRVSDRRIDRLARLVGKVQPMGWSEHLAFVRAGDVELGHLGAPPRNVVTLAGTLVNLERATRIVGTAPLVENVASLIEPPGSTFDEARWLRSVVDGSGTRLLLDLHNVHANAHNFAYDARALLAQLDLARIGMIHLAGGRFVPAPDGRPRILDDHQHAVPEVVFDLLRLVAERAPNPLTVIVERDGDYPPFEVLLEEVRRARAALALGRQRRGDPQGARL